MKRFLSVLLVLVMLFAMMSVLTGCHIKVSKTDAQRIAAETFGFNTSQVTFVYTKLNSQYATTFYTVVYQYDGEEYAVGVNAETGEITSKTVGLPEQ